MLLWRSFHNIHRHQISHRTHGTNISVISQLKQNQNKRSCKDPKWVLLGVSVCCVHSHLCPWKEDECPPSPPATLERLQENHLWNRTGISRTGWDTDWDLTQAWPVGVKVSCWGRAGSISRSWKWTLHWSQRCSFPTNPIRPHGRQLERGCLNRWPPNRVLHRGSWPAEG